MFKQLNQDIESFFARDPAARTKLEIVLCYPGFHALILHRLAHLLWRKQCKLLARWLGAISRFLTGIEIHPGARVGNCLFIDHGMGVVIGETAAIGDRVTIYHGVTLGGTSFDSKIRHPQVGDDVVIGSGAQLLGPVLIGDGARIGANAVVVGDVKAGKTMVGVPARMTRKKTGKTGDGQDDFDAYGAAHGKIADPNRQDIQALTRRLNALEQQLNSTKKSS